MSEMYPQELFYRRSESSGKGHNRKQSEPHDLAMADSGLQRIPEIVRLCDGEHSVIHHGKNRDRITRVLPTSDYLLLRNAHIDPLLRRLGKSEVGHTWQRKS